MLDGLRDVPAGLIGALEEKGQILSVKAGEIFDIGFGDFGRQLLELGIEHPFLSITALITLTGGLYYYYWSRYTVSGNWHRLLLFHDGYIGGYPYNQSDLVRVHESIHKALVKIGARAIPLLIEDLGSSHSYISLMAFNVLEELRANYADQVINGYLKAMRSSGSNAPYYAIIGLGSSGNTKAVPLLIEQLRSFDHRKEVVQALGDLGDRRAIEPLKALLISTSKTLESYEWLPPEYEEMGWTTQDNPLYFTIEAALKKLKADPSDTPQSSSPITPQEARALIKGKLAPEHHHLINDTHVQLAMAYEGDFKVVYHAGPPESIEIVRREKFDQSSSPVGESRQSSDVRRQTSVIGRQPSVIGWKKKSDD